MIGPKLPDNFVRKIVPTSVPTSLPTSAPLPTSNGGSNGHQNGTHVNGDSSTSDPVVSCTTSLSSLDILRASYTDDSSSSTNTAQPVLSIKKKKKKKDQEKKTFNWDEKDKEVSKNNPAFSKKNGSVFTELAKNGGVKTWNGGDSKNVDTWSSISNPNKRGRDEYEIELDRGKAKKFKQDSKPNHSQKPAKYLFQNAYENQKKTSPWDQNNSNGQNGNNKWNNQKSWGGNKSHNGSNGYKGNFHNKNRGGQKKHYNNHRN